LQSGINSTYPRKPFLGSFNFFSMVACSSFVNTEGLNPFYYA
jgi:hypothetical protein